jgi:hypothetical protein
VLILFDLKPFVLIQIREFLEVLILQGLGAGSFVSADSKAVKTCDREEAPENEGVSATAVEKTKGRVRAVS